MTVNMMLRRHALLALGIGFLAGHGTGHRICPPDDRHPIKIEPILIHSLAFSGERLDESGLLVVETEATLGDPARCLHLRGRFSDEFQYIEDNLRQAERRAKTARSRLIEIGVAPERISISGIEATSDGGRGCDVFVVPCTPSATTAM